jgi:hypothetical protein
VELAFEVGCSGQPRSVLVLASTGPPPSVRTAATPLRSRLSGRDHWTRTTFGYAKPQVGSPENLNKASTL